MEIYGQPITCHPHDYVWIMARLKELPNKQLLSAVIRKYSEVYKRSMIRLDLQATGDARREANTRLRKYIKNQLRAYT